MRRAENCLTESSQDDAMPATDAEQDDNTPRTSGSGPTPTLDENKVREFLLKEIVNETRELENQSLQISEELNESLRLFRQLKRSVVGQYYASNRSNVRVHPAIVKAQEELDNGPSSSGGEDVKPETPSVFSDTIASRKSKRLKTTAPCLVEVPSKPVSTFNVRIYVGTMCKYLGNSDTSLSTHKWTVYLRNCDSNPENVCRHISRVTFVLHDSYKPNQVVKVKKEPFKITREGWGEFAMKINIAFHEREHNKNVELVHPVNFLHVKSTIPIITLETPIDIMLNISDVHTVINEEAKRNEEVKTEEKTSEEEKGMREVKKEVVEPDLRQTVLEYLTDEDMMMGLDDKLGLNTHEEDIDMS
ncbi:hypothetical protein WDU94_014192 [Cyamophila willieti]